MNFKTPLPATALSAAFLVISAIAAPAAIRQVPPGQRADVSGIQTACGGIGIGAREAPNWDRYRVKFEATGGYGQYLAGEDLTVKSPDGQVLARVSCAAPWISMQLSPGTYDATMRVANAAEQNVRFSVPAHGRKDIVVRFATKMAGKPSGRMARNAQI